MSFKEVAGRYDGPTLEQETLEYWRDNKVFEKTLAQSTGRPLFTFNEGPPTANGKPGIHHVLARAFKDAFPRYKTMRGYHVPRKAGWDTHGLPVEHEIEKELGIFDKKEIEEKVGIEEFTRRCRESVMRYIGDWEKMTERMGFWVNLDDAYYTLDNNYIESVWNLLQNIWDKDLIYRGYKVVPYDPRIGATLSSHELAQGYREVDDPSVFVRFRVEGEHETSFLVWTTTPWTLPANLLLAVHRDVDYVYAACDGETLILAEALCEQVFRDQEYKITRRIKGAELVGKRYARLFDYLRVDGDAFRVVHADFVSTEDGTGIVHTAPAYGVDDLALGQEQGLPVVHGVGEDGHFLPEVTPVAGLFFKEADKPLIRILKERGLMFRAEQHRHNYPFGWRTGDPIIYYAKNAWYIRTSNFKERMVELNQTIKWVPETIRDGRFGNWLENNIDWALSRERFWGTPLPVWTDGEENYLCVGSVAELENLAGRKLAELDLHRPAVDEVTFEKDGRTWRRVPEVIDCWFDSGAMSYAQWHYPFENRETFEEHFPVDYICEAIDQTRGWFYTLHAIATLVSDSVAYRNCICLSHIVDKDGKKMSKSIGNIVSPYDVFDTIGADALRWYFLARLAPEAQKRISVDIVADVASSFINTFWNTYGFFILYARIDDVDLTADIPVGARPEIDRWAMALAHNTISRATAAMDDFDAKSAGEAIESFVDQLSNWYVRRNRRRFWKSTDPQDKLAAYLTLYECLNIAHRLMAPFTPFLSEAVYQNLVRGLDAAAPASVHMSTWPEADAALEDAALLFDVDVVQKVVGLGRAARNVSGVRTRQPLSRLLLRAPNDKAAAALSAHSDQILEELNVKTIEFIARDAGLVDYRIKPNLPRIGKTFGKRIPLLKKALDAADGAAIATAAANGDSFTVQVGDETATLTGDDVLIETSSAEGYSCAEDAGFLAALDTALDDDLRLEGIARELVRTVQDARKQAGLEVSDRIVLGVSGSPEIEAALAVHRDFLMQETLAIKWSCGQAQPVFEAERDLEALHWSIEISKLD
ncbi:MAG: isoleucine--tRNA ligase [Woeseia sp.]|nr:isoleucine--tRNA ligase [Woeseia sp.]MBT8095634.1 isoleucine--tRNA ligase [Woeseia sp.]NNE61530.1 isoleucine--tRNA ligase [Woeseia sp.]NNL54126.1 isoleucine--tRNA ligase [Woeseia sp.]